MKKYLKIFQYLHYSMRERVCYPGITKGTTDAMCFQCLVTNFVSSVARFLALSGNDWCISQQRAKGQYWIRI